MYNEDVVFILDMIKGNLIYIDFYDFYIIFIEKWNYVIEVLFFFVYDLDVLNMLFNLKVYFRYLYYIL